MQLRSTNAKHKLVITAFLLTMFAVPFALQWASIKAIDTRALIAGGAVIANQAADNGEIATPSSNHASQAGSVSGKSFLGVSTK